MARTVRNFHRPLHRKNVDDEDYFSIFLSLVVFHKKKAREPLIIGRRKQKNWILCERAVSVFQPDAGGSVSFHSSSRDHRVEPCF